MFDCGMSEAEELVWHMDHRLTLMEENIKGMVWHMELRMKRMETNIKEACKTEEGDIPRN